MIGKPAHDPIVEFSTGLYRLLLRAYPARFRRDYGPEMAGVFLDSCLQATREGRATGIIELWVVTLFDLARSAIEEHAKKETGMSNPNFVRISGWALIVGAVLFLPTAVGMGLYDTPYALGLDLDSPAMKAVSWAAFSSPLLLAVGLLGLRARYGHSIGSLGRGILLGGAGIGGAMVIVGTLGQQFASSGAMSETYWGVWAWGLLLLLSSLFIFGILALIRKPLPRWNGLPLVAGSLPPLVVVVLIIASQLSYIDQIRFGRALGPGILMAGVVIMTFALILLGYVLQGDAHQERPAFA